MSTHSEIYAAIAAEFETEWNAATAVEWENAQFNRVSEWVRFVVRFGETRNAGIANGGMRRGTGKVEATIFVAKDIGIGRALSLADDAVSIFVNKTIGDAVFRAASISLAQPPKGKAISMYQVNVIAPFKWDIRVIEETPAIPTGALQARDASYILARDGNYIIAGQR